MLYLFYRKDDSGRYADDKARALRRIIDYDVRAQARHVEQQYADPAGAFNVQRLDGETDSWGDIVSACSVLPFFTSHQVVRIQGLIGFSSRRRSKGAANGESDAGRDDTPSGTKRRPPKSEDDLTRPGATAESLGALVAALPDTTVLILEEGTLTAANPYIKKLDALLVPAHIHALPALVGSARAQWIRDEVARRGGAIDGGAAALLAQQLTDSLWAVANTIDTLIAYAGPGGRITVDAVTALVVPDEHPNTFEMTDAIAGREAARALTVLHTLLAERMAVQQIMAILVGRIRDWTLAAACKAERVAEQEALTRLGWNPGKYRMTGGGAAKFGRGELPRAYQALVLADEALKSRREDEHPLILDMLILALATRGDPTALREMFPIVVTP